MSGSRLRAAQPAVRADQLLERRDLARCRVEQADATGRRSGPSRRARRPRRARPPYWATGRSPSTSALAEVARARRPDHDGPCPSERTMQRADARVLGERLDQPGYVASSVSSVTRPGSRGKYTRPRLPDAQTTRSGVRARPRRPRRCRPVAARASTTPSLVCAAGHARRFAPWRPWPGELGQERVQLAPLLDPAGRRATVAPPPISSRTTSWSVFP